MAAKEAFEVLLLPLLFVCIPPPLPLLFPVPLLPLPLPFLKGVISSSSSWSYWMLTHLMMEGCEVHVSGQRSRKEKGVGVE